MCDITLRNRLDSIPENVLKSVLRRDIFLLSRGLIDLPLESLSPTAKRDVLWDRDVLLPENTALVMSVKALLNIGQHSLYRKKVIPSVPGDEF